MIINTPPINTTPMLPLENRNEGGKTILFLAIMALTVTGGILYWQYRKGEESEE